MDLRHLRTLIAIADHRSFAAAGDAIGLTQSAVSLHIKALEGELNCRLFDRTTRPPRLNDRGRALVERAREIVQLCDGLGEQIGADDLAGVLDVGAVPTVLTGILPPALARLRQRRPKLRIRVTSGLSDELVARVQGGDLDVAAVTEPAQRPAGLDWHAVTREPLMVIAPEGTPGDTDEDVLTARPFIRFRRFAWAGRLIDAHLRERGIRVEPGMEMDSLEAVAMMVGHGLGVSVVPLRAVDPPFPPGVRAVPFGRPPIHRVVGLIERADGAKRHLNKALLEVLADIAARGTV